MTRRADYLGTRRDTDRQEEYKNLALLQDWSDKFIIDVAAVGRVTDVEARITAANERIRAIDRKIDVIDWAKGAGQKGRAKAAAG
jgi:hypothetical protein